jgi:endonuclease-3
MAARESRMARAAQASEKPSPEAIRRRATRVLATLARSIPTPHVELAHRSTLELLMATILSAQCTDQRVNQVTPALFKKYRSAAAYAKAQPAALQAMIKATGFYKNKAKSIIGCAKALNDQFGGNVPSTMEELVTLPGVGRKTANVILGASFGKPAIVVDTHVKRVAHRLGFTHSQDADRIEEDLQRLLAEDQWTVGSQRLLLHGRYICLARRPKCEQCPIYADCVYEGKFPR